MATIAGLSTSIQPVTVSLPTTRSTCLPVDWNLADLQEHLGGVPLERIRLFPPPGMATVEDVNAINDHEDRLCELIDGILVEKTMGALESELAFALGVFIKNFAKLHDLGTVLGADGFLELTGQQVRGPDVSFIGWQRLPGRVRPTKAIPALVPDLAVEVLSKSNTVREMKRKLADYFTSGVQLVWYIDPVRLNATVYTSSENSTVLSDQDFLDGGNVLPGFRLSLRELFAEVGL